MKKTLGRLAAPALALAVASLAHPPAAADGPFGLDLSGSLGEGKFDRADYVPPVTHFTLAESPFITTEVRPIFAYHGIPSGFASDGGRVIAGAVQARVAFTDRFAFIATSDGFADVDFDAGLPDDEGFLDIAAGVKYAIVSDPAAGQIVTLGLRYTASTGNIETAGIDLTGSHAGFLDAFVSAAKIYEGGTQVQGTAGVNWGLSERSWSFVHLHGQVNHEVAPGFYPLIEANLLIPVDGGDRLPGANLTSIDIFDLGAEETGGTFTLGIGARYRPLDNMLLGAAVEGNIIDIGSGSARSPFGWRLTADVTIHF